MIRTRRIFPWPTQTAETYNNFRQWLEWDGRPCSNYAYWYFQARWKDQQVTLKDVGQEIDPASPAGFLQETVGARSVGPDSRYTVGRQLVEGSKSMTAQTKGRIRHVALSVKDPWETAEFYKQAVGLQEVTELDGPLAEGVFLTDGVVNLAILHFKSDEAAQGTGKDFVGIHHIGFWVDDVVEQGKIARDTGATWIMGDPNNPTATR